MAKDVAEESQMNIVYKLLAKVGNKEMNMSDARIALREHVASLSEDDQKEFRAQGSKRAGELRAIAEGFSMELTVIGAGQ